MNFKKEKNMTIRTFWIIFIKILGIWLVFDAITAIPYFLYSLPFLRGLNEYAVLGAIFVISLLLLVIGFYILVLRLLFFKTAWVIDKLKLEKNFEENKIELNVKLSTIWTVAIIIIGGLMFLGGLPEFCKEIFLFFQMRDMPSNNLIFSSIIFNLIKIIFGYLIMTNCKKMASFINKNSAKENVYDE
ncbi:MAG: hypothetical protein ABI315_03685 [Bacteroidia bacterium]